MKSFLASLQNKIEQHLNSHPSLKDIPVISHKENDFDQCLNELIHSGIGLCIVVLPPLPKLITPTQNSLAFEDILIRIQIIEAPCTHINSPSATAVAENIALILHNYSPKLHNYSGWLSISPKSPWSEPKDPIANRFIIQLTFNAS